MRVAIDFDNSSGVWDDQQICYAPDSQAQKDFPFSRNLVHPRALLSTAANCFHWSALRVSNRVMFPAPPKWLTDATFPACVLR